VRAEVVAEGLEVPWELAFPPDGRILVTERLGRIRVIRNGVLQQGSWATLEVASVSESGLMGMALHPQFATNGYLYVCYTYRDSGGPLRNRVARLTDRDGLGVEHQVILDGIPGAGNHDGCRLGFGPDGKLYVTMGDAEVSQQAQNLSSLSGKVLRLEADGSAPDDNPIPGSFVYTYGHRNPQGMAWHPRTGDLFITEHGPDTNDEVNILRAGSNYGWPQVVGIANDPRYVDPILTFTPTIALAGAAFYSGQRLPASWEGNFLFANLKASHLHRVILTPSNFRTVLSHQRLFEGQFGRLRAVALAPDGYLYFTTSNRDGRGTPRQGDDKVLRLLPASSSHSGTVTLQGRTATFPAGVGHGIATIVLSMGLGVLTLTTVANPDGTFALQISNQLLVERGFPNGSLATLTAFAPGYVSRKLANEPVRPGVPVTMPSVQLRCGLVNSDNFVNINDITATVAAFGTSPAARVDAQGRFVDQNGDGFVNINDITCVVSSFGTTSPQPWP
jgi:glucose/arabinose dehydrogenase